MKNNLFIAAGTVSLLTCLISPAQSFSNRFGHLNEPGAGVNIHFTKGHEKDLDMIAAAGLKYIRMDFIWQETEKSRGVYDWSDYDELTAGLRKRGISAIYILDYSNSLYEDNVVFKDPITGEEYTGIASPQHPGSIEAYVRWAAAAVKHFSDSNIIWEIWNEPNITFWRPVPDVNQYIRLAESACKAIKTAAPGSIVIGPGTSQIPFSFIESFLASGILEYLDGVSVHPYRDYSKSPETAVADYIKLRELIDRYSLVGKKDIPIISSEWGYASAIKGISTEKQAAFIVRMQLSNLLCNIPVSIWYDWKNDGDDPGNFEHNCGTVTSDLTPKPAYTAIKTMNSQLNGFSLLRRIDTGNENDFLLLFRSDKGIYKLCAWTTQDPHSLTLDEILPGVTFSDATDWSGNKLHLRNDKKGLTIDLTEHPCYMTLTGEFRDLSSSLKGCQ